VAAVAGTRGGWVMARRSGGGGTSTRTRQFRLHPQDIRGQGLGCAAVIVTSSREEPRLIRVLSPTNHR
jgi:hypothetical protein